jgi:hypothetical protein
MNCSFNLQSVKVSQAQRKQYVIWGREAWDQCSERIIGNWLLLIVLFCKWGGKNMGKRKDNAEKKLKT